MAKRGFFICLQILQVPTKLCTIVVSSHRKDMHSRLQGLQFKISQLAEILINSIQLNFIYSIKS